jgi:hypothetical protein
MIASKQSTEAAKEKETKKMPSIKNDFSSNQRGPKKTGGWSRKKGSPLCELAFYLHMWPRLFYQLLDQT